MELYKIPSCWPINFINGIPLTELLKKENLNDKLYYDLQKSSLKLPQFLIDFVFQFCNLSHLSYETSEAALLVFMYYVTNENNLKIYDLQLVAMTCILISSKMFDIRPLSLNDLHKISNHIYNNDMILKCEIYVLQLMKYNFFLRDNLLTDRVGLFLSNVKFFFNDKEFKLFKEISKTICILLYEDSKFFKSYSLEFLSASLIQSAVVITTKREGKLPITLKLSMMSHSYPDDIIKTSKKIIKHCLGKNIYSQYNF